MDKKDSIEIEGRDNKIEIENAKEVEIKGNNNVVEVEEDNKKVEITGSHNIVKIEEKKDMKKGLNKALDFLKKNKIQWIITIVVFLIILFMSTSIRLSNLDALIDPTTGNYSLADLDAQYFYRIAQTALDNNGLPAIDNMRYIGSSPPPGWLRELLPKFIVFVYKLTSILIQNFQF